MDSADNAITLNTPLEPAVGLAPMNKQQLENFRADLKLQIDGFEKMSVSARRAALVDVLEGMEFKLIYSSLDELPEVYQIDSSDASETAKAEAAETAPGDTETADDADEVAPADAPTSISDVDAIAAVSPAPTGVLASYEMPKASTTKFISNKRNLVIKLGKNGDVRFDEYIAVVPNDVAKVLKDHFLFHNGHIMLAEHAVQTPDGKLIRINDERVATWLAEGKRVFMFPGQRRVSVKFRGYNVNFDESFAALSDPDQINNMRSHVFFVQGRIIEVAAA